VDRPPSATQWRLESELVGHSEAETVAWASWVGDFEDERAQHRALPATAILAGDVSRGG
jgi:hypothetical protein